MNSRTKLKIKNAVKSTKIGRSLRSIYQTRSFTRSNAEATFKKYKDIVKIADSEKERIVDDMMTEARKYSFSFNEYFMYHFYDMPQEERREYVSDLERITYCERMNSMKNMIYFDDKALTYEAFSKYYSRDLIEVFSGDTASGKAFSDFVSKHPKFIIKPFDGACGKGIKIVECKEENEKLLTKLLTEYPRGFVAEELIIQSEKMAVLHPQSVNTLRIPTISYKDRVEIIHPFLRVGRGDAVVDNGGSGGIGCGIDTETGEVFSACDEMGNYYTTHPDTGKELVGFKIPEWEKAKELVKELTKVFPDNHYTGWDLALTDNGWVLQEANDRGGFMLFQTTEKKGFRKEIEKIVKDLNV